MFAKSEAWTDRREQSGRALRAGASASAWLFCVGALAVALAGCNIGAFDGHSGAGSAPTTTPTAQPTPTATFPPSGPPAILGGLGQAFISKYGAPTAQSNPAQGELHFGQYSYAVSAYLVVQEGKYLGVTPGDENVLSIQVTAPQGQPWTVVEAKRSCAGFGPTDKQFIKRVTTTSQGAVVGWDDIYQSASLTNTFPASAFLDANQRRAPWGSFDITYLFASSGDMEHVTSCTLAIGERQTIG
ncbi:MAG TPA: hypothetical protein VF808_13115 [Ktedonobacterales bacterium]